MRDAAPRLLLPLATLWAGLAIALSLHPLQARQRPRS